MYNFVHLKSNALIDFLWTSTILTTTGWFIRSIRTIWRNSIEWNFWQTGLSLYLDDHHNAMPTQNKRLFANSFRYFHSRLVYKSCHTGIDLLGSMRVLSHYNLVHLPSTDSLNSSIKSLYLLHQPTYQQCHHIAVWHWYSADRENIEIVRHRMQSVDNQFLQTKTPLCKKIAHLLRHLPSALSPQSEISNK